VVTCRKPSRLASAIADGVAPFRDFPVRRSSCAPLAAASLTRHRPVEKPAAVGTPAARNWFLGYKAKAAVEAAAGGLPEAANGGAESEAHRHERASGLRNLWRSIWQTLGPERRHFSHGIFNRRPSRGAGTNSARRLQALVGAVCWRRVGRIDLLHRGIRTGRTARFHRLLATGQRRLGLPVGFPKRCAPQFDPFA